MRRHLRGLNHFWKYHLPRVVEQKKVMTATGLVLSRSLRPLSWVDGTMPFEKRKGIRSTDSYYSTYRDRAEVFTPVDAPR